VATQKLSKPMQLKVAALNRAIFLQDPDAADKVYAELRELDPGFVLRGPVHFELGRLLQKGDKLAAAVAAFEAIIKGQPESPSLAAAMRAAGEIELKRGRYREAMDYFESYLKTNPEKADRLAVEKMIEEIPVDIRKKVEREKRAASGESLELEGFVIDTGSVADGIPAPAGSGPAPAAQSDTGSYVDLAISFEDPPPAPPPPPPLRPARPAAAPPGSPANPIHIAAVPESISIDSVASAPPPLAVPPAASGAPAYPAPRQTPGTRPDMGLRSTAEIPLPRAAPPAAAAPFPSTAQGRTVTSRPPGSPAPPAAGAAEELDRLRDGTFAVVLPQGVKINIDEVARFLHEVEGIDAAAAKKRIMRQKGVLYQDLDIAALALLKAHMQTCAQQLLCVYIPPELAAMERLRVTAVELVPDKGMRLQTSAGTKRLKWAEVRLVNCGSIEAMPVVSIVGGTPPLEFDLAGDQIDFTPWANMAEGDRRGVAGFLTEVMRRATNAQLTHTARRLLEKPSRDPQVFADREEFTFYTTYVAFALLGEKVDIARLVALHEEASNW
jgi:tetratricopeptide (TPR) repeat protein